MSSSALADGLRHLRGKLAAHCRNEETDEQLLHAFLSRRDESAFAVLVHRHGPMVLHVCRRVLGHQQDAEDAFQASFLVLARNAGKLRKKSALASFLHGIAYRTALKAKQTAARRRKYEGSLGALTQPRSPITPADELSWREVRTILDEEIARLPEIYGNAFVLCCLEEMSRKEAAQQLGVNENTLSSRLAEARKRLGQRLARRGVELTAVLAAITLAAQSASALPPVLISTTVKAALGEGTAARVAGLAKSAASAASFNKLKIVTVALLIGSALSVWLGERRGVSPPVKAQTGGLTPRRSPETTGTITIQGRVFGPDGKPIHGARLYATQVRNDPPTRITNFDFTFVQRGLTDAEGRFRVELPRADLLPMGRSSLLALADGYGADWAEIPASNARPELTLRLVKDQPIQGRILSTEGKPLAGVRVRAIALKTGANGRLDAFLSAWQADWQWAAQQTPKAVSNLDQAFPPVLTDRDGRFRISGAGIDRVALLQVQGKGIALTSLRVIVRPDFNPAALNAGGRERPDPLFGPRFEYVAGAERIIEGTVRETGSGKPVPGYTIYAALGDDTEFAVSDKEGRYRLAGLAPKKQYSLIARPPEGSPWLEASVLVQDVESVRPHKVDFTVGRGVVVTGRILDKTTGAGVPGVVHASSMPSMKASDREGRFRVVIPPSPCVLLARAYSVEKTGGEQWVNPYKRAELGADDSKRVELIRDGGGNRYLTNDRVGLVGIDDWNAVKYLDLAPDAADAKCDLFVERGQALTVKIEDHRGKPLPGTTVAGVTDFYYPILLGIPETQVTIYGLDPKRSGWLPFVQEKRRLVFLHTERQLGGVLYVRGDEKQPLVARLTPTGTVIGRILNLDGQPRADVNINILYSDGKSGFVDLEHGKPFRTDKDGRFRVEGVVPGLTFDTLLSHGRAELVESERRLRWPRQVKSGQTLDLGELRVKPAR